MELVPVSVLKEDDQFYDFIVESNNILGERQIINLIKIRSFCQDFNLLETRQSEMKRKCLEFWQVPDKNRTAPKFKNPDEKARELLQVANTVGFLKTQQQDMTPTVLNSSTFSVYDWKCLVIASKNDTKNNIATFFLGKSRTLILCNYS
jgi:cap1 methyltransferase